MKNIGMILMSPKFEEFYRLLIVIVFLALLCFHTNVKGGRKKNVQSLYYTCLMLLHEYASFLRIRS